MKKIMITAVIFLTVGMTAAFANGGDNIPSKVLASFQREFAQAQNVKWDVVQDYVRAAFNLSDFRVEAYFNNEGELMGTARNILFNQLPLSVIKQLNQRFGSVPVYEIIEYNTGSDTFYNMKVELTTKIFQLKANPSGEVFVEKKIRK